MVQLSVLLCFIPLCLDNAMMQAHITKVGKAACSQERVDRTGCDCCCVVAKAVACAIH